MTTISANLQAVKMRIAAACAASGRKVDEVQLVAVSKTWAADRVATAATSGLKAFGENYLQEGVAKIAALAGLGLEWHFIGPLQSNKTRQVAENFAWVHTLDRAKVAERLSAQRPAHLPPLQVCIQVNVSGEQTKSGVNMDMVLPLARQVVQLPGLRLRGLMAIPEPEQNQELVRLRFRCLREMRDELNAAGLALDTLSMGMSHDLEAAITEGATIVRVGTAIFGERNQKAQA
jgi:pyridoxal phosphate enzyme (YggS family)